MLKKTACLAAIVAALFGLEYSKIYVSENFEKPFFYKFNYVIIKSVAKIAKLAASLKYGTEHENFRNIVKYLSSFMKQSIKNVKINDTLIDNVSVRIYTPASLDSNRFPIMIYYHGGAYVFGSSDEYNLYLSEIVKQLNLIVISVNYRLAPESPYPAAFDDCYAVANYVFANNNELNGDPERIIIAGDSSGGNAVAVVNQRLLAENKPLPKLQILIYPRTQMINFRLPSYIKYDNTGLLGSFTDHPRKFIAWYLGINNVTEEIEGLISSNMATALVDNNEMKNKIISYLDIDQIPKEFKDGKNYYDSYEVQKQYYYAFDTELEESHLLKRDKEFACLMKKLFSTELSPLLSDLDQLKGLPKTYFIICEWDALKDEGILYAERLKSAGVDVTVGFYEDAFHGIVGLVDPLNGYQVARKMLNDLVIFIQNNI